MNWSDANQAILQALDIRAEFQSLGVQLTGREPNSNGWLECRAAGREDRDPSAAINLNTGRYVDRGGEGLSLSLWDFAAQFGPYATWQDARKHYAKQTGVKLSRGRSPVDPAEHLEFREWHAGRVALWCRHKPPITPEAVGAAGGRLAYYRGQFHVIALPIFGAGGLAVGPVGWCLLNTSGQPLPIFRGKGQQVKFAKIKTTYGSEPGLIGFHALDQLEQGVTPEVVWKTAGPTDLLALWSAIPAEQRGSHLVLSNAFGENETPIASMLGPFQGVAVYVISDADKPGEAGAGKWVQCLAGAASEVRHVRLPYPIKENHGPDARDYLAEGHVYQDLMDLATKAEPVEVKENLGTREAVRRDASPARLARLFIETQVSHPDGPALRSWEGEWWLWEGRNYRRIARDELRDMVWVVADTEFVRMNREALEAIQDQRKIPEALDVTTTLATNVINSMSSLCRLKGTHNLNTWLDGSRGRHCVSLENGILDIEAVIAGQEDFLAPHSPLWFSPVCLPYRWEPDAEASTWSKVLHENMEGDQQRIDLLQEWAGYLLTPDTSHQKFLFLEGEGGNGKSVYCAGLVAMLGQANVSHVSLENFGGRFALYGSIGKLANIATEIGELDRAAEGILKSYTAGDPMTFDRKGLQPVEATPTARLILATNNRPRFSDRSSGLWRRMIIVPFRMAIPPERRILGMDKVEWWEWSGELSGIFNWALVGLFRLRNRGQFTNPLVCQEAQEDYRLEINPAKAYLVDHCEADNQATVTTTELYEAYKRWCKANGYLALGEAQFGKEVRRVFPRSSRQRMGGRTDRTWIYQGIDLVEKTPTFG